ncbi:hypothetical protein KY345_04390 [Candidatus Woesearchaeota archaeon]|nr:hypothetical protein [Candidatus Woesearchaeota archaeon]
MMKKVLFILPFIILAIAFSGCAPAEEAENVSAVTGAYIGGDKGLELSFLDNAPPGNVFDKPEGEEGNPFDVAVKIENKGEYTVAAGKCKLTISGVEPTSFGKQRADFTDLQTTEELLKTRKSAGEVIPGTFTILTISELEYQSPVSGFIGPFNLRASVCYEYQTEASSSICVLEDLLGVERKEGICKATESKTVENSGGPVQVKNFEQSVTGKESTAFTFDVQHAGGDKNEVYENKDQSCSTGEDKVRIQVLLGEKDITTKCSGISDGMVNLRVGHVRCPITIGEGKDLPKLDYVQPVKVILTYDYKQYTDKAITVKQVGT